MRDLWSGTYNEPAYWDETATALISMAELRPGSAVLDVGTGYGGTLFRALDRIGGAGRIVGIDVEAECVDWTKKEVAKRAISNAEILLMNARSMSFPDTGFDVVIAGMVGLDEDYDFSAGKTIDGTPMMREIFRVLKPGGRLFISGWLWQEHLEWMGELVRRYLPGCERRGYSPATEEGYVDLLSGVGFERIRAVPFDGRYSFADPAAWLAAVDYIWEPELAGSALCHPSASAGLRRTPSTSSPDTSTTKGSWPTGYRPSSWPRRSPPSPKPARCPIPGTRY